MNPRKQIKSGEVNVENGMDYHLIHRLEQEGIYGHDRTIPIYKYVACRRAQEILRSNSIFYASCNDFNDPFEFHESLLDVNYE